MEPDVKVLKFTKVLSEMDEALLSTLHPRKTKVCTSSYPISFELRLIEWVSSTFSRDSRT